MSGGFALEPLLSYGDDGRKGRDPRDTPKWSFWHLCAALLGVAAVVLGAYGAHVFDPKDPKFVKVYDTGTSLPSRFSRVHNPPPSHLTDFFAFCSQPVPPLSLLAPRHRAFHEKAQLLRILQHRRHHPVQRKLLRDRPDGEHEVRLGRTLRRHLLHARLVLPRLLKDERRDIQHPTVLCAAFSRDMTLHLKLEANISAFSEMG